MKIKGVFKESRTIITSSFWNDEQSRIRNKNSRSISDCGSHLKVCAFGGNWSFRSSISYRITNSTLGNFLKLNLKSKMLEQLLQQDYLSDAWVYKLPKFPKSSFPNSQPSFPYSQINHFIQNFIWEMEKKTEKFERYVWKSKFFEAYLKDATNDCFQVCGINDAFATEPKEKTITLEARSTISLKS